MDLGLYLFPIILVYLETFITVNGSKKKIKKVQNNFINLLDISLNQIHDKLNRPVAKYPLPNISIVMAMMEVECVKRAKNLLLRRTPCIE